MAAPDNRTREEVTRELHLRQDRFAKIYWSVAMYDDSGSIRHETDDSISLRGVNFDGPEDAERIILERINNRLLREDIARERIECYREELRELSQKMARDLARLRALDLLETTA
ncbi:hypothetical protein BGZ54_003073, partial [Gamsiella multidivaricata]